MIGVGAGAGAGTGPRRWCPLRPARAASAAAKVVIQPHSPPEAATVGTCQPDHNLRKVKMASSSTNRAFEEAWEEILPRGLYRAVQFTAVDLEIERTEEKFDFCFKLATGLIWATTWTSIIKVE